ncbi:MAG: AmmeMemoRadiSam system radical SAM enzyme [Candidatus Hodarchaeota archaeon]
MKEALFYEKIDAKVKCGLCNHRCSIPQSKKGICGVRQNKDGMLYSLVYGRPVAQHIDPIEKKPLYHFYPGSYAYSIATVGCNFKCKNCQNADISQMPVDSNRIIGDKVTPERIVKLAKQYNCSSIAYTYTEPVIFYEYAYDISRLASDEGIKNIFITNGYITEEALREISPYLDAANIDLKSFSDDFYRKNCGARLKPVLDSIELHKELGIWIEVTTLVIPTLNDSSDELRHIAEFIKSVGEEIPWHVSAFYPTYRLRNIERTPTKTLRKAREIGLKAGLRYVYTGNILGDVGEHTYCYKCGTSLIRRYGFEIMENRIKDSKCPDCGAKIDIVEV